ncbi:V-type ATP synthase subunit I [Candidatus Woesearchaeota archaeon]|nr:V-type ATP synthase subunit I [Candidatus Woesearchaeota archaeon]
MLKPHEMSSVIITGPNSELEAVIKEMHDMGVLHIVEHSKNELADTGKPLDSAGRLSETLVKIRALTAALSIRQEENRFELKKGLPEIESNVRKIGNELGALNDELKKTEELVSKNDAVRQELEILKGLNIPLENFTSYKSLACFMGCINEKNFRHMNGELSKTTKNFLIFKSGEKRKFIALFIDSKNREDAGSILNKNGFSQLNFSNIGGFKGTAMSNLKRTGEENARLQRKRAEIKNSVEKLANGHKAFLAAADKFLSIQLEKAEAPLQFASTPSSFLIKGWIPSGQLNSSIERLNKAAKNMIFVHFEPAKAHDKVPVKLKNPKYAKSFEFFIDLYSMPTYREIDPTFFIFLTFPIFFGIMLGDVGYGITSLLIFWLLKKKMPKAGGFFNILMLASFVSMLFGFLYGEFFGYEFIHPVISREHEMFTLMYMAIAIGIVHVNLGLAIGFINELKSHGLMKAVYEKLSWIILEIGAALLALSYFGKISISPLIGAVFLGLSILMLFKGEGVKGLMELPSIFTNILSYARLMAIGLSSVVLAVIINDSAKEFFHQGGFFVLIGVLILVVGHIINIMLGLLGSFLHSLRLHYVEFFSKFFHGGAKKYQPFGMKED